LHWLCTGYQVHEYHFATILRGFFDASHPLIIIFRPVYSFYWRNLEDHLSPDLEEICCVTEEQALLVTLKSMPEMCRM
jgi:hypothetical protein